VLKFANATKSALIVSAIWILIAIGLQIGRIFGVKVITTIATVFAAATLIFLMLVGFTISIIVRRRLSVSNKLSAYGRERSTLYALKVS